VIWIAKVQEVARYRFSPAMQASGRPQQAQAGLFGAEGANPEVPPA